MITASKAKNGFSQPGPSLSSSMLLERLAARAGALQHRIGFLCGRQRPRAYALLGQSQDLYGTISAQDWIEAGEKYSGSLMCLYAALGRMDKVTVLSTFGHNVNVSTVGGHSPLFLAVRNRDRAMAILLLSSGADPDFKGQNQMSPRALAHSTGQTRMVELIRETARTSRATKADARLSRLSMRAF